MRIKPFRNQGGYTQFDNWTLDYIMPSCKPNTWKVVCVTLRMTRGWQKEYDMISLSQYQRLTGISSRETLMNAIKDALAKGYINREKCGDSFTYSLNRAYEIEIDESEILGGDNGDELEVVRKSYYYQYGNRTAGSTESVHTKETLKILKENMCEINEVSRDKDHDDNGTPTTSNPAVSDSDDPFEIEIIEDNFFEEEELDVDVCLSKTVAPPSALEQDFVALESVRSKDDIDTEAFLAELRERSPKQIERTHMALDERKKSTEAAIGRFYEKQAKTSDAVVKADLSFVREGLRPLAEKFVELFGRGPTRGERSRWIKDLQSQSEMGLTPDDIERAYAYHRETGLSIKSPASLSAVAYDKKREKEEKEVHRSTPQAYQIPNARGETWIGNQRVS
jgi:hypothetical protein